MSFRPRHLVMALVAGLSAFGFGVSQQMADAVKRELPASNRRPRLSAGAPLRIQRKHAASRPPKHSSRTKARKRQRCRVKRRTHRG